MEPRRPPLHHGSRDRSIVARAQPFFDRVRRLWSSTPSIRIWRVAGWDQGRPRANRSRRRVAPHSGSPSRLRPQSGDCGADKLRQSGLLPRRTAGDLRPAAPGVRRRIEEQRRAASNAQFYAAILSHYVADAHVPFHATVNYDGQLTGQRGIHARFEGDLFARYRDRLTIAPPALAPVSDARGFIFDRLAEDVPLAARVLAADRDAAAAHPGYNDAYYEQMYGQVGGIAAARISAAIAGTAAMITGAWAAAGRPTLRSAPSAT
jgi:hypothetical protein